MSRERVIEVGDSADRVRLVARPDGKLLIKAWEWMDEGCGAALDRHHALALAESIIDYLEWTDQGSGDRGPW